MVPDSEYQAVTGPPRFPSTGPARAWPPSPATRSHLGVPSFPAPRWRNSEHRQGEIGFVFHPDHHGKGLAAEAATELLRLGFEDLGMRKEAHLRENEIVKGEWTDEVVYAMLEDEWKANR